MRVIPRNTLEAYQVSGQGAEVAFLLAWSGGTQIEYPHKVYIRLSDGRIAHEGDFLLAIEGTLHVVSEKDFRAVYEEVPTLPQKTATP